MNCADARARVERQFDEGALPALEAQALRAHLRQCADCRAYYDQLANLEDALDPAARAARVIAGGRPRVESPPARSTWPLVAAGLAAAAALMFLLARPTPQEEFAVRGGGEVKAAVEIFVVADGAPTRARTMRARDGLAFAYTLGQADKRRHLGIVARDAKRRVRWYFPVWKAGEAPTLPRVKPGADREIPQVVRHELAPGPLQVCALFSKRPESVKALDSRYEGGAWPPPGARCQTVQVKP